MLKALYSAATGMNAQQMNIDITANNVANINTAGYKKVRAEFQDLMYTLSKAPGSMTEQGTYQPVGIEVGLGVKTAGTARNFTGGTLQQSNGKYDMAIEGDGFFRVQLPNGTYAYTRDGSFKVDANGQLVTTDGYTVDPQVTIPQDALDVTVTPDGRVSIKTGVDVNLTEVGQIQLIRFINPQGMTALGKNMFSETSASGPPIEGTPGQDGFGTIQQGYIEGSNVQVVEEMMNLIMAERAFESNSKVITAASQMLQQTNNLR